MPWRVLLSPLLCTTSLNKNHLIAGPARSHLSLVFMHSGSFHAGHGCSQALERLTLFGQNLAVWVRRRSLDGSPLTLQSSHPTRPIRPSGSRVPVIASLLNLRCCLWWSPNGSKRQVGAHSYGVAASAWPGRDSLFLFFHVSSASRHPGSIWSLEMKGRGGFRVS